MNAVVESVRSLWVPLDGVNLLVPNVAVAEVINYRPLEMIESGPAWLLASLNWRNHDLPTVAIESLCGSGLPQGERGSRIAIFNSVRAGSKLPFYAIVTAGIPRLFSADADALGESLLPVRNLPDTVADCIQIGNEEALIPDLEVIQSMIEDAWSAAAR